MKGDIYRERGGGSGEGQVIDRMEENILKMMHIHIVRNHLRLSSNLFKELHFRQEASQTGKKKRTKYHEGILLSSPPHHKQAPETTRRASRKIGSKKNSCVIN